MPWQPSIKQTRKPKLEAQDPSHEIKATRVLPKPFLKGYKIVDTVFFQAIGDPVPGNHSPFTGKSRTSDPKSELEIN